MHNGKWKNGLSFGTWNVRTLFKPGAVQYLVEEIEKYKLGVVALQEIRLDGNGMIEIQDTTIFYGKLLTIEALYFNISFVNGNAPTEEKPQEKKDEFYDNLEHTLNEIPRNRIRIVLGDFNAKLGKEIIFRSTVGIHSLHDVTSENGFRLIDFASGGGLIVKKETIDTKWKMLKDTIKTVTDIVIGKRKITRKPWFNNSCNEAFNIRKETRTQLLNDPTNREKAMVYKERQKEASNIFRYEKRKYTKDVLEEAELKNYKTPGEDGIQGEVLKNLDELTINKIHSIIESVWHEEILPKDWGTALICPIHKKNDPQECINYRGIALLDTTYKFLAYFILDRVRTIAENLLGDYQGGFRPNKSTTDQIFVIRQILQKSWEYNKDVHILFVDFKKAYDSIHRESLVNILKGFRFPSKIVNLIGATISQTDIKVKIANTISKPVGVTTGLRQGDALSPVMFNLVLEKIVREMNISEGIELVSLGKKLIKTAEKVGLTINDDKTEYLVVSRSNRNYRLEQHIELEGHTFKKVSQFKYLGSIITQDNELKIGVSSRIQLANKGYYGLEKILKLRTLSKNLKIRMYMTLLRPIVLYGSETWALRKAEEQRLGVFELKRPDIVKEITKKKTQLGGHAWRKQGSLVRQVIENKPIGKRPLGRPRLRWEDCVKKDLKMIDPGIRWTEAAEDRDRWQDLYLAVWS
ncbi:ribosome biogenesis protein TSR3 isoform X1 [Aphis craccivora]|uniref:Ribosome biogenesis protein TSR3 isoform X1 n=1 Tax=Aphis craccivora TaxID=307492 RepID=A0A6G0YCT3_APHCR|nr:ribosome biogenesis protein TSR3 isoform X1 [Aphis craccivora]